MAEQSGSRFRRTATSNEEESPVMATADELRAQTSDVLARVESE
jgi:hypothetical protein